MEATDEVLVVIQAESGEEIALPLAALDEQHHEVVVGSDGMSGTSSGTGGTGAPAESGSVQMKLDLEPIPEVVKPPEVPRQKQKRKEKLVYLPLKEDDLKLVFQVVEEPSPQLHEENKRKPRKEYRTKKKIAMEAAKDVEVIAESGDINSDSTTNNNTNTHNTSTSSNNNNTNNGVKKTKRAAREDKPSEAAQTPQHHHHQQQQQPPSHERRTRLSNACRVATGKSYRCNDCDFSTERINNIIIHVKETCPKIKKEKCIS